MVEQYRSVSADVKDDDIETPVDVSDYGYVRDKFEEASHKSVNGSTVTSCMPGSFAGC